MRPVFQALCVFVLLTPVLKSEIILTLSQSGSGVAAFWSGSGTVDTGTGKNPGAKLNFNNFSGSPFSASGTFMLDSPMIISSATTAASSLYTNSYDTLKFSPSGSGGSDITFDSTLLLTSIENDFTFDLRNDSSGDTPVRGLLFSQLNPGTYSAATDVNDASDFGGFTMKIVAASVPEPRSIGIITFSGMAFCVWNCRRRRKLPL